LVWWLIVLELILSEVQGFNAILCGVFFWNEDVSSKYFSVPKLDAGRLRDVEVLLRAGTFWLGSIEACP
jgi:hypothetical protein